MDTDDDVSTFGDDEEACLSSATLTYTPDILDDCSEEINLFERLQPSVRQSTPERSVGLSRQSSVHSDVESEVKFQVMCAHTEKEECNKYVVYSIMVERGEDDRPALLERRYSDFLVLHKALRQSHPALLAHLKFPRKVVVGNFKLGVIEERSASFQSLLKYIHSKSVLKCSEPFRKFLYRHELISTSHHLLHSRFEEAIPTLENLYYLLDKLHSDRDLLLRVILQLIVSLHAVTNYESAFDYVQFAIPRFECRKFDAKSLANELYIPFLVFCTRLYWMLGKDRGWLEEELSQLRKAGTRTEGLPDLLDILRDEISLRTLHS